MTQYVQTAGGTKPGKPYIGSPITCNLCGTPSPDCFVDGKMTPSITNQFSSSWAIMCLSCFKLHGAGLGVGIGQKYCKKQ